MKNDAYRRAIGLKYHNGDKAQAPQVIAKGSGELADEIIALAEQHGILVHQDEALCQWLAELDLGQQIPPELYHVIAELIAFSFVLQGRFPDSWNNLHDKVDDHA